MLSFCVLLVAISSQERLRQRRRRRSCSSSPLHVVFCSLTSSPPTFATAADSFAGVHRARCQSRAEGRRARLGPAQDPLPSGPGRAGRTHPRRGARRQAAPLQQALFLMSVGFARGGSVCFDGCMLLPIYCWLLMTAPRCHQPAGPPPPPPPHCNFFICRTALPPGRLNRPAACRSLPCLSALRVVPRRPPTTQVHPVELHADLSSATATLLATATAAPAAGNGSS